MAIRDSRNDDPSIRSLAAYDLGDLVDLNSSYKQDPRLVNRLIEILSDENEEVRGTACDSLAKHGYSEKSVSALLKVMRNDPAWGVRYAAVSTLSLIVPTDALIPILQEAEKDSSSEVRAEAEKQLQNIKQQSGK